MPARTSALEWRCSKRERDSRTVHTHSVSRALFQSQGPLAARHVQQGMSHRGPASESTDSVYVGSFRDKAAASFHTPFHRRSVSEGNTRNANNNNKPASDHQHKHASGHRSRLSLAIVSSSHSISPKSGSGSGSGARAGSGSVS
eukprot:162068-Rhodomonas_salina.2